MAILTSLSSRSRHWREGLILTFAVALFLVMSLAGVSQEAEKHAESAKPAAAAGGAKKGAQIFQMKCIICHNKQPGDNSPFGPPNLFQVFKNKAITSPQAEQIITRGKGQMPAFGNILSKGEMASVIEYLKAGK